MTLDLETLLAAARSETGLDDFGDCADDSGGGLLAGLRHYVEGLDAEARLPPMGVEVQRGYIHKALVNRLRFQHDVRRHPEIREERIEDPIYIVGLPRTGTTKLFRMLSTDPGVQQLLFWRAFNPAPLPGEVAGDPTPRIAAAKESEALLAQHFPDFCAMHEFAAQEAEEDLILQEYSFQALTLAVRSGAYTTFMPWLRSHDPEQRRCYRHGYELLQYLQWQDGGAGGRPWVLKNIMTLGHLPTVLETHPRAVLVQTHRDPLVSFASTLKLFELARVAFTMSPELDLAEHGRVFLDFYADAATRNVAQRTALGEDVPIIDVSFDDIRDAPLPVLERIHALRGAAMTDAARDAARSWEAGHPQHRLGRIEYSLERYGLSIDEVADAFGPYIEHFGLKPAHG